MLGLNAAAVKNIFVFTRYSLESPLLRIHHAIRRLLIVAMVAIVAIVVHLQQDGSDHRLGTVLIIP